MERDWMKLAAIYIGTVIGAGFASGREIIEFFAIYGRRGILGMVVSGLLFSLVGALLLMKIYKNKISSFNQLVSKIFGEKLGFLIDTIIAFSLYTGFSIMISGSGAIFQEELGLPYTLGIVIMAGLSFLVFLFSLEGLSFINSILVPLLIVGILFTSIYIGNREGYNFSNVEGISIGKKGNFISSAFIYVGSNSLIILVVFSSLLPLIKDKKTALLAGLAGGSILGILGLAILGVSLIYYNEIANLDIPMLRVSSYIGLKYRKAYGLVLWIAMFTTALANGFGFMERLGDRKRKIFLTGLFCLSAVPLARLGFSNLVGFLYPVFGFIGVLIMGGVLLGL